MNTGKKLFLCAGLLAFFLSVSAQSYSLRTNVIGLATTNLNLEASMTLNRKWSLHLPVQYNPFKFGRNRQFRNFYAAPGVRYWLLESYMGGFIGMYGTAGTYSVGNLFGNKYRYEGEGYGVGLSIGKAYQIGRRWNLEWEAGAGAVWLAYDKYLCKRCGDLVGQEYGWHFLPTVQLSMSCIFLSGKDEDYKTYHTVCTALGPAPFLRIGAPSGTRAHFAARGEGGDNGYGLQGAGTDSMDRRQG